MSPLRVATGGKLPHDHRTYIRRAADAEFARLLTGPDRLISLPGKFGIGKSRLMLQARRILPTHEFFGDGLADLNSISIVESRFMRGSFNVFAQRSGSVADWDELDDHVRQSRSVLFLDDLSEVAAPGLSALIPALVERFAKPGNVLHVITTTPKKLKEIFAKRDLENPNRSRTVRCSGLLLQSRLLGQDGHVSTLVQRRSQEQLSPLQKPR